jgi:GR25 family glycosyltransferase involved in LPS biosynthesis
MADRSPADAASLTAVAADRIRGFYINLDRSIDRRNSIEAQIETLGIGHIYKRFPAVDGSKLAPAGRMKPGEVGIFRSHRDVLAAARGSGKFIHVLEDDQLLSEFMMPAIGLAVSRGMFDRFDIIFTDIGGINDFRVIRDLKLRYDESIPFRAENIFCEKLQLIDLARFNFAGMTSYVVSPAGVDRLLAIYAQEMKRGLQVPVDLLVRREVRQGRLRAAAFFPFLTTSSLDSVGGTTSGRTINDSFLMMALLRHSFFVNRDLDGAAGKLLFEVMARAKPGAGDRHHEFIMTIMSYILSKEFKPF